MTRLLILASMLFASAVFAQVEIPHVHENGDVIDADEINANFEYLAEQLPPQDCSYNQIIKWNGGTAWVCASKSIVKQDNCTGEGSAGCVAACAEGTTVVSGGCEVLTSDGPLWEYQSTPKPDLSGWLCAASVNTGTVTVSASAICQ